MQKSSAMLMAVMQALERALRTGNVLLTAAQADALWSVGCGDAIEDAKQAINRYSAMCIPVYLTPGEHMCLKHEVTNA